MKQRLAILGSTGSIGVQTLDIVRETPSLFEVRVLTANSNWQRLAAQAREFDADTAVIADKRYYTPLRDALEVRADGRGNGTLIVAHGIGIDKSPADTRRTPKVQITENIIKFGPVKHNAPQQQRTFTLTNTGDGELIVRAVETGGKVATTLMPGQRIPAGSSFTAKATLDPGRQEYGVVTDFVTIITNDPTRPMRRLRATAIVED